MKPYSVKTYIQHALIATMIMFLLAVSCDSQAEDYGYIEISQGIKIKDAPWGASNWQGDYPTAINIGYTWDNRHDYSTIEFSHTSNILDGPPFNDRSETWLDVVWYKYGIKF